MLPTTQKWATVKQEAGIQREADPNGIEQHKPGAKLDQGKLFASLVLGDFARALEKVSGIGTFGANKYTERGWLSVPNGARRYADARMRHWLRRMSGESYDPDSGMLHLAHEAWNVLAELELYLRNSNEPKGTTTSYSTSPCVPGERETLSGVCDSSMSRSGKLVPSELDPNDAEYVEFSRRHAGTPVAGGTKDRTP